MPRLKFSLSAFKLQVTQDRTARGLNFRLVDRVIKSCTVERRIGGKNLIACKQGQPGRGRPAWFQAAAIEARIAGGWYHSTDLRGDDYQW